VINRRTTALFSSVDMPESPVWQALELRSLRHS
jgi:hypothetical protein